jgi:DNA helicase-2/ATP-dependent DNA helicase PcrA
MDALTHPLTDEGRAIINATKSSSTNLMIEAYAGCGKTTLLEACAVALGAKPILYLCFNKKNAVEAAARMPYNVETRTLNAIGHRIWAGSIYRKLTVDFRKTGNILKEIINGLPRHQQKEASRSWDAVVTGVSLAKSLGYAPPSYPQAAGIIAHGAFAAALDEIPTDLVIDLIDSVLTQSIRLAYAGTIDFNDQVYMPALFRATFPAFPNVLVDEYQDLSPANAALLAKLATRRLIGVGDPYQNIYGFRGAQSGGMSQAKQAYDMTTLPLSLSFRCPSEIVSHVQWHVPGFRAAKTGGSVHKPVNLSISDIPDGGVVICRNNAPLLRCALSLLTAGRGVSVAGSDIGTKLISTMRKLGPEELTRAQTLAAIADWLAPKLAAESKTAEDLAACMQVFAQHGDSLGQAIRYAEHLFAQAGSVHFTTGHKAKGLEWDYVVHLDPFLVRAKPTDQNKNLDYVISTRSANTLVEIESAALA